MAKAAVPAAHWDPLPGGAARCRLCPKECLVRPGEAGDCLVRANRGGTLFAEGYGRIAALAVEPVEKKPLFHYMPGSWTFSLGTFGCNMHCDYCQNWTISQRAGADPAAGAPVLAPEEALRAAEGERRTNPRVRSVCFTYTEPAVSFEYLRDVASLSRAAGFRVLLKTNGFVSPGPWAEILSLVDAVNIDLKGVDDAYYARVLGGHLCPVQDAIATAVATGVHVEVTTLLVPGEFESPGEVSELAAWLARLSPDVPLHLPRFYPDFRRGGEPASRAILTAARDAARRHLRYVYLTGSGVAGDADTLCDACGTRLVARRGFAVELQGLRMPDGDGGAAAAASRGEPARCAACGSPHAFSA